MLAHNGGAGSAHGGSGCEVAASKGMTCEFDGKRAPRAASIARSRGKPSGCGEHVTYRASSPAQAVWFSMSVIQPDPFARMLFSTVVIQGAALVLATDTSPLLVWTVCAALPVWWVVRNLTMLVAALELAWHCATSKNV